MTAPVKSKEALDYTPDYAVAPGETLREVIESLDMTQKELAIRTQLTEQTIVRILKGVQPITYETANKLEMVTGVPARMWNNLEMQYREQLSKIAQKKALEAGLDWLKGIPTKELIARGVISSVKDKTILLQETLKFYGVSSVEAWSRIWTAPEVSPRRSSCFETQPGAASAWIRLGELQAQRIDCAPYDKRKFEKALRDIRKLTIQEPEEFEGEMKTLCAEAGVALSLVPEMRKVPWNGASKWLSPHKAMILLSLRGKREDIFWFSFFHEAEHVLRGKKQHLYIAENNSAEPEEEKADRFAAETLIPAKYNPKIIAIKTKKEIKALADELGIAAGIVAGRYRYLTKNWKKYHDLTRTFKWAV